LRTIEPRPEKRLDPANHAYIHFLKIIYIIIHIIYIHISYIYIEPRPEKGLDPANHAYIHFLQIKMVPLGCRA